MVANVNSVDGLCREADLELWRLLSTWEPMSDDRRCRCDHHSPEASWHDSWQGYNYHHCRCPGCAAASRAYINARNATPEGRVRTQAQNAKREHARRARRLGLAHEDYDRNAIFERDDWTCGICGNVIDARLEWPHPLSASLDHILPLSRGGPDTASNVQAAHLRCNNKKRASVPTDVAATMFV